MEWQHGKEPRPTTQLTSGQQGILDKMMPMSEDYCGDPACVVCGYRDTSESECPPNSANLERDPRWIERELIKQDIRELSELARSGQPEVSWFAYHQINELLEQLNDLE